MIGMMDDHENDEIVMSDVDDVVLEDDDDDNVNVVDDNNEDEEDEDDDVVVDDDDTTTNNKQKGRIILVRSNTNTYENTSGNNNDESLVVGVDDANNVETTTDGSGTNYIKICITTEQDALEDVHTRYIVNGLTADELQRFSTSGGSSSKDIVKENEEDDDEDDDEDGVLVAVPPPPPPLEDENDDNKKDDKEMMLLTNKLFFQLEQAWWFYDDFYCDNEESFTRYANHKQFAKHMFSFSPYLKPRSNEFNQMWYMFRQYKNQISTYGTILLNQQCTHMVLVQTYGGKSWTIPGGKVNVGENELVAGARETYEETGFDPNCHNGLTKQMKQDAGISTTGDGSSTTAPPSKDELKRLAEQQKKLLGWYPIREADALNYVEQSNGKRRTCYVCRGVPMTFPFSPQCRKEVSDIQWFPLGDLPKRTFAVLPFMKQLRRWIKRHTNATKKRKTTRTPNQTPKRERNSNNRTPNQTPKRERKNQQQKTPQSNKDRSNSEGGYSSTNSGEATKPSTNKKKKNKSKSSTPVDGSGGRSNSRSGSRGRHRSNSVAKEGDDIVKAGLASPGEVDGWSEEDMFSVNAKLTGRQVNYDGNPHNFIGDGEDGMACHRFHVVGGTFMNTTEAAGAAIGKGSTSTTPKQSRFQPLFCSKNTDDEDIPLQPFFTDTGSTPWGEVVPTVVVDADVAVVTSTTTNKANDNDVDDTNTLTVVETTTTTINSSSNKPKQTKKKQRDDKSQGLLDLLQRHSSSSKIVSQEHDDTKQHPPRAASASKQQPQPVVVSLTNNFDDLFLTDQEITKRSQAIKLGTGVVGNDLDDEEKDDDKDEFKSASSNNDDLHYMKQWVETKRNETTTKTTKLFQPPTFRFDMDTLLQALYSFDH